VLETRVSSRLRVGLAASSLQSLSLLPPKTIHLSWLICLLLAAFPVSAWAQEKNPQSAVDSLMRSSLHVDPASGAMQMQIPLGEYRGTD
jgi:hypothetical protein